MEEAGHRYADGRQNGDRLVVFLQCGGADIPCAESQKGEELHAQVLAGTAHRFVFERRCRFDKMLAIDKP